MKKLNLGSGGRPIDGYINVDISPKAPKVEIVHDLDEMPWPFEGESIDEVLMAHCLEHLKDHNLAMREIHRILKPGGHAIISVPHFTWQLAYGDPTHKHFFAYPSFYYYVNKGNYFDFKFSSCKVKIYFGKRLSIWNFISLVQNLVGVFNIYIFRFPYSVFYCQVALLETGPGKTKA